MRATMSFYGLQLLNPKLWDDFQVPANVNKDAVVSQIMLDTIELEVLIPNSQMMQAALGIFSTTMLPSWTRYAEALAEKYNVLDTDSITETRTEDRKDTETTSGSSTRKDTEDTDTSTTKKDTTTDEGTSTKKSDSSATGQNTGTDTTERDVVAYDSSAFQPSEKTLTTLGTGNTLSSEGNETVTDSKSGSLDSTVTETKNNTLDSSTTTEGERGLTSTTSHNITRTGHAGRDPQDLIQKEIALAQENVARKIVDDVKRQFCLLVY